MVSGLVTDLHPVAFELASSVTTTIYRRYKNYVEKDDIKQECVAWAIGRTAYINEQMSELDDEKRKHNESRIAFQMRRAAERYARKEKASKSGYQTTDEAYYKSAELGQLLPYVIASVVDGTVLEQIQQMIQDGQPKGKSSPSEGGNLLATLIDIKRCFLKLDIEDQNILRLRHFDSLTLKDIAAQMECAVSTADRRCQHSLRRLIELLGGPSPWQ
jgi:DNA-directed RNA polymerase specialized sigma24 family protein